MVAGVRVVEARVRDAILGVWIFLGESLVEEERRLIRSEVVGRERESMERVEGYIQEGETQLKK